MATVEVLSPAPPEERKVELPLVLLPAPAIIPRGLTPEEQERALVLEKELREADEKRRWNGTLWPKEPQPIILP